MDLGYQTGGWGGCLYSNCSIKCWGEYLLDHCFFLFVFDICFWYLIFGENICWTACILYLYLAFVFGIWGEYLLDRTVVNILPSFPIHAPLLPRTLIPQFEWMMNFDELLCTGKTWNACTHFISCPCNAAIIHESLLKADFPSAHFCAIFFEKYFLHKVSWQKCRIDWIKQFNGLDGGIMQLHPLLVS